MPDTAVGYLILGIGILVVLGVVFAISSRSGGAAGRPTPPRGVHLPPPSYLPVVMSVGMALLGAGLVFRADEQLANPVPRDPGTAGDRHRHRGLDPRGEPRVARYGAWLARRRRRALRFP